jgi:threonine/homoserine/homoserine lactone efflux protein
MLSVQTIIAFASAALVLAFIPGPDNIFVLTQSAMRGWRVGIAVTLGLCMGLIVHTTAVALGWRSSSSNPNWPLAR